MSEQSLRRRLLDLLPRDACAHEDAVSVGVPDVSFGSSWIELKFLLKWPARAATIVRPNLTRDQRKFLIRRAERGTAVTWALLQVDREYLLHDGETAARLYDLCNKEDLYNECTMASRDLAAVAAFLISNDEFHEPEN